MLREFDILDEIVEKDRESDDTESSEFSGDLEDEKQLQHEDDSNFEEGEKIVTKKVLMKERSVFDDESLPEGWAKVMHDSGVPLYFHKTKRVCTLSHPYFLGPGSARKHDIPINAIPCLQKKLLTNAVPEIRKDSSVDSESLSNNDTNVLMENELKYVCPQQFRAYCEKRFKFKTINVLRFDTWSERRKFTRKKKELRNMQPPVFPDGAKLVKFPIPGSEGQTKKEWVLNLTGKSTVSILHEYVQHVLRKQPSYVFHELENAATPYSATVIISNMQYGVGYGTSKKQAKLNSAKATLDILIPDLKKKVHIDGDSQNEGEYKDCLSDYSIFDKIKIEDPRVSEICNKTAKPSPYATLISCIEKNFGFDESHIKYDIKNINHQQNEFTMTVDEYTTTVICKNKQIGKQLASQAILQLLHPYIHFWGSLLRLYGNESVKPFKEKKEEGEIVEPQKKNTKTFANYEIMDKLRLEMQKFYRNTEEENVFKTPYPLQQTSSRKKTSSKKH